MKSTNEIKLEYFRNNKRYEYNSKKDKIFSSFKTQQQDVDVDDVIVVGVVENFSKYKTRYERKAYPVRLRRTTCTHIFS